jgi:hypothetical protein
VPWYLRRRLLEGVARCWRVFEREAARGHQLDPALLVYLCRLRALELGRQIDNQRTQRLRDALDPRNVIAGRVSLVHLDALDYRKPPPAGAAERLCSNPACKLASAVDLRDWLATLPERDRQLLELPAEVHTWAETGRAVGMPPLSRLRRRRVEERSRAAAAVVACRRRLAKEPPPDLVRLMA